MMSKKKKKKEAPATLKAGGAPHKVYKEDGKVVVDHLGKKGGKYDKINLTKHGGAKTVKEGVKAVKSWHKSRAHGRGK
jgi:hypothetical protein